MVFTRLHAKFRHRTTRRFGGDRPRQNKHTLKYLVDETTISEFLLCLRLIGAIVPFVFKRVFYMNICCFIITVLSVPLVQAIDSTILVQ